MAKIKLLFADRADELIFIEANNEQGKSINVGEWTKDNNGYQTLTIDCNKFADAAPNIDPSELLVSLDNKE